MQRRRNRRSPPPDIEILFSNNAIRMVEIDIDTINLATLPGLFLLILTHIVGYKITFLSFIPRSGWLSFSAGISLSYVFVLLIPEIKISEAELEVEWWLEQLIFLTGMCTLVQHYSANQIYSSNWFRRVLRP